MIDSLTSAGAKGPTGVRRWVIPVLCVAAASHSFMYFAAEAPSSPDAEEYLALGRGLAETGELRLPDGGRAKRMPLYPLLIAAAARWQGPEVIDSAVLGIQSALALAATLLIAATAARLADDRAAIAAGIIAAMYAPYRYLQTIMLSETLVIFLMAAAVYLYVVWLDERLSPGSWAALAGAGTSLGLALLSRADAAVLAIPFVVDAASRRGPAGVRMLRVGVVAAVPIACTVGWGLRNADAVGAFCLSTNGGLNFFLGHNADYASRPDLAEADYGAFDRLRAGGMSEIAADRELYRRGRTFIAEHPGEVVVNWVRKAQVWFAPHVVRTAPTTLLVIGWLAAVPMLRRRTAAPPRDHGGPNRHEHRSDGPRTGSFNKTAACAAAVLITLLWSIVLGDTYRPWASPVLVVPLGILALFFASKRCSIRMLLIGIVAAQMLVALAFIPIVRLRWSIDFVFIIALGVGLSHVLDGHASPLRVR